MIAMMNNTNKVLRFAKAAKAIAVAAAGGAARALGYVTGMVARAL